jgi:hypothetical protein
MWTRISATVPASAAGAPSKVINLQEAVQWAAGDVIVLVTTAWKGVGWDWGCGWQCGREGDYWPLE